MQSLEGYMRAAIDKYKMIEQDDKVAVGVSGGKDSLVLLKGLSDLRNYHSCRFEVIALCIDPCFNGKETDYSEILRLCENNGVKCVIKRTELGKIIFEDRKEKNPCSLCARMRRGILHNLAKENGCNKLALGHHMDDAIDTFFMNLYYGGNIGCFSPKTYLSRKDITVIRPMIFCSEHDIARAAVRLELPVIKSECPANGVTARAQINDFVKATEKSFPDLRSKVIGALQRNDIDDWGKIYIDK